MKTLDKKRVISAYHRGFLSLQECAQVIGTSKRQIREMIKQQNRLYK